MFKSTRVDGSEGGSAGGSEAANDSKDATVTIANVDNAQEGTANLAVGELLSPVSNEKKARRKKKHMRRLQKKENNLNNFLDAFSAGAQGRKPRKSWKIGSTVRTHFKFPRALLSVRFFCKLHHVSRAEGSGEPFACG